MKKITTGLLLLGCCLMLACQQPKEVNDDKVIEGYLATHSNYKPTRDASGLYYQILTEGKGANPTANSTVTVNYTGMLINGIVIDHSTAPVTFGLGQVIQGWQTGLRYAKPGGRILLIVPSKMAYGNDSPSAAIPANAVLVFTIDLISVKP